MNLIRDSVRGVAQRLLHAVLPVRLDQVLEIPAVGGRRVRDICREYMRIMHEKSSRRLSDFHTVVGEPSLKLGLMPLVVDRVIFVVS